jgi:hypothetical protein
MHVASLTDYINQDLLRLHTAERSNTLTPKWGINFHAAAGRYRTILGFGSADDYKSKHLLDTCRHRAAQYDKLFKRR